MALELVTGPSVEPISLAELKLHVRTSGSAEDTLLAIYIAAARLKAEAELGRALINQTWRLRLDAFGGVDAAGEAINEIKIPKPTVQSITSVTYVDTNEDTQTLATNQYTLDAVTSPGWLYPAVGVDWPETSETLNAVAITFVAGYGATAASVPADIRNWILLTAGFLYANREAMDATGRIMALPNRFLEGLLDPHRVYGV